MRKLSLLLTSAALAAVATVSFAANGQFRGHSPRVSRSDLGLTPPSSARAADVVRGYLQRPDAALRVTRESAGVHGATHVQMEQSLAGLPVYGAYVKASVDSQGRLTSVIEHLVAQGPVAPSQMSDSDALVTVLSHRYPSGEVPAFYRDPAVSRVVVPMSDGSLEQGFLVETWEKESNVLWHTVVGRDGAIVHQELRTNTDSYFIFPDHPGNSAQTVVAGPGTGNAESPSGWVSTNTTIGNNVDAYLDRDNSNSADTNGRPVSSTQDFIYTWDGTVTPTTATNQMLAVSNLFYLNNVIHDKLYRHGFNEAAGNFQTNNFGKGGAGNDPVNAEAQDGGGTNNANFSTPSDGSRPRMQMYLWTQTTPNRDGDLDSDIVYHEYGHGLTWRMIGSMSGGLAGAIGEGMSDTVALYMNGNDAVGEYSYNRPSGIRRYVYTNYPLTYGDATGGSVHNDGEIYAATMWKLRSLWLASGRSMDSLWSYVVDGMNYTPSNPEYEEMRDGILAAIPTQTEDCIVWDAFSQFGIGLNAAGTDSCNIFNCSVNVSEDFTKPSTCGGTQPPAGITLSTRGYKSRNIPKVDLTWSGASTAVDIFRNGSKIVTGGANDGAHTDTLSKGSRGTFTYKVCNTGTTTCSNESSVSF